MVHSSTRAGFLRTQQMLYDEMRPEFDAMGTGRTYCQPQREYAFRLINQYGVRATARILDVPRRTLQRWRRRDSKYVRRCPDWVYSWAAKRLKKREFWGRGACG